MVRNLEIIKVPRKDKIPDIPISFGKLANLHLDLIENKKKLKPGLPLIQVVRKPTLIKPSLPPAATPVPRQKHASPVVRPNVSTNNRVETKEKEIKIQEVDEEEEDLVKTLAEDDSTAEDVPDEREIVDEEESVHEKNDEEEKKEAPSEVQQAVVPVQTPEQELEEYIWRCRIMKKKYPKAEIPDFNEHSDLTMVKSFYNRKLKELCLDDSVESYRYYLFGSFVVTEIACTYWLGVDMTGLTKYQMKIMYKYEKLLIELGERPYNAWGASWPVEVRIAVMVLFNSCLFFLGKMIADKVGDNVADMFRGLTGQPMGERVDSRNPSSSASSEESTPPKKKKMRGPSIKAEDIRKMAKGDED